MNQEQADKFIERLAKSTVGRDLIKYLKQVEIHYSDMRALKDLPEDQRLKKLSSRLDALEIIREALLDKLLVMSGEVEPPNNDEYH